MQNQSSIYILYNCNEWKEYSSMKTVAASTGINDIYRAAKKEIHSGNIEYCGLTKRAGVQLFSEDLINNRINTALLDYGYIEEIENIAAKHRAKKGV